MWKTFYVRFAVFSLVLLLGLSQLHSLEHKEIVIPLPVWTELTQDFEMLKTISVNKDTTIKKLEMDLTNSESKRIEALKSLTESEAQLKRLTKQMESKNVKTILISGGIGIIVGVLTTFFIMP